MKILREEGSWLSTEAGSSSGLLNWVKGISSSNGAVDKETPPIPSGTSIDKSLTPVSECYRDRLDPCRKMLLRNGLDSLWTNLHEPLHHLHGRQYHFNTTVMMLIKVWQAIQAFSWLYIVQVRSFFRVQSISPVWHWIFTRAKSMGLLPTRLRLAGL